MPKTDHEIFLPLVFGSRNSQEHSISYLLGELYFSLLKTFEDKM
jgi:hypothetical protein